MNKEITKVLILRFSSIGDIVLCTPVIRNVKKQLGCEVHFLTKNRFTSLVSSNPYIDKLWSFNSEVDEVVDSLKKESYDLVIDLHKNLRSLRLKKSLGVKSISFDKINIEKFLMVHFKINRLPDKHLIDRYMESIDEELGVKDDGDGMDFFYNSSVLKSVSTLGLTQNYIVLVLGATYYTKRVPLHLMEQIIEDYGDKQIVLLGGADVSELGITLSKKYKNTLNLTAKLSLQESAAVIDQSRLVLSGDTGMMHIAAALKKPIVSIWGSTFLGFGMYPYYGKKHSDKNISIGMEELKCRPCSKIGKHKCPRSHFDCMMQIEYSRLKVAIDRQLKLY